MALYAVTRNPPDLILVDIMMSEMDGFEVCRQLAGDFTCCLKGTAAMTKLQRTDFVIEPEKRVPVAAAVDVAVAGGGISGMFAALAAARMGARTVLIERFGALGGNMGPGYFIGGDATGQTRQRLGRELPSIPREFFERLATLMAPGGGGANSSEPLQGGRTGMSCAISYLANQMADEAGVEQWLSVYAADPVLVDGRVNGVFIEGKSGRVAVQARVVVDATGDASLAERAGASIIRKVSTDMASYGALDEARLAALQEYDESGLFFMIGNVDFEAYQAFLETGEPLHAEDQAWAATHIVGPKVDGFAPALIPLLRQAWERGEFRVVRQLQDPEITVSSNPKWGLVADRVVGGRAAIAAGQIDMGNMRHITLLEKELRVQAFETAQFLKRRVPGFERSYLLFISAFAGSRGGPCIAGEHTLTLEESLNGTVFPDVLFRGYGMDKIRRKYGRREEPDTGFDVPYRILLPRGLEGLLVTARGAAYIRRGHDGAGQLRNRPVMMALGQAAGAAAALCAARGETPRTLDIQRLQRALLRQGFHLGDAARLAQLGLGEELPPSGP